MATTPAIISEVRYGCYSALMVVTAFALSAIELVTYPVVKLLDPTLYAFHRMTTFTSSLIARLFVKVIVKGKENIPRTPVVIVCNHQSDIDNNIISCAIPTMNFKVIFKRELLFYPGIGSAFYMVGHVPVHRGNKESGAKSLQACANWLKRGAHIFFFPEGTRKIPGPDPIGVMKPGAFRLAMEAGVPILPLTISGARAINPMKGFKLGFGTVNVTVHPLIQTTNKSVDALLEETRALFLRNMSALDEVKYTPPSGASATGGVLLSAQEAGEGEEKKGK